MKKAQDQEIATSLFRMKGCRLFIRREDLLFPAISGNKYRKLYYNLQEARKLKKTTLVTFGGAYSNHIPATAAAGKLNNMRTIGFIRGDELAHEQSLNPTLTYARSLGMEFRFLSRDDYKKRYNPPYLNSLLEQIDNAYLLPEGGTNSLAVKGCMEILDKDDTIFDYICVPVGTGGTLAGLLQSMQQHQLALGFSVLKGTFQQKEIEKYPAKTPYKLLDDYCFGGYAKIDSDLVRFINAFKKETGIPLDPVYTGKMMFGIEDLCRQGYFKKGSNILAIHTGGLQGIAGMNQKLKKKHQPQIIE